ncbi:uncharacterized protein LOC135946662 isoform X2 [Cloeon dipterum]|uniref:uncharacterized protein LOC135946662 isoform X2 n=1 Tax=Cloeon dipterum TaxID=197152 RepID=UPI00321FB98A
MKENKSYVDDLNQSLNENDDQYKKLKDLAIAEQKEVKKRMKNQLEALTKELNTATKPKKRPVSILSLSHPIHNKIRAKLTEDSTGNLAVPSTSRAHDNVDMGSLLIQPSVTDKNPTQKDVPEANSKAADENTKENIPKKLKKRIEAQTYKEQIGHFGILTAINSAIRKHAGLNFKDEKYRRFEANVKTITAVRRAQAAVLKTTMTALQKQDRNKRKYLESAAHKFLENLEIKPRKGFEEVDENINLFAMKLAAALNRICSLFRELEPKLKNRLTNKDFEEFSELQGLGQPA